MLHTLRGLIGDDAFWTVTRLAVYGRADPRPGNFRPRFGSTAEYEALVRQVTGKDYRWFFDVYLRQAALPDLVETRAGDRVTFAWTVPGGGAFPMPIDVQIGTTTTRLSMTDGRGTLTIPVGTHYIVDPDAKVLRRSVAVEEMRAWRPTHGAR